MDRMSSDQSNSTQNDRSEDGLAAGIAAIASSMEKARQDEARARRRAGWGAWIWRGVFVVILVLAALGSSVDEAPVLGDQIARYTVDGVITDDPERDALLKKIAEEDRVKALILRINSPGGTTTGGEALYESIRAVADKKPVVAVMGEVAASAGYITAMAADHLVARGNTITGSVGVIFTAPNFHELLEKVGVSVVELKSGARKAEPSPYKPVDPEALEFERQLVDDSFQWFLSLVKERRAPSDAVLAEIRDGRVLTGRMAAEAGLVDVIGGQVEAIAWLEAEKGVKADLPVVERKIKEPDPGLLGLWLDQALAGETFDGGGLSARVERLFNGPALLSVID